MQGDYVAEAADAFVKGGWLVRAADAVLDPQAAGGVAFAIFLGPLAEERAKDYAAGLERGRLRLVHGGRAAVPLAPAVPALEIPAVH